ncbi:hypothetical protein V6N13_061974 [Hibiscus sabdariffa]|uniref:Uncharacterized protein n=1 Tax=Hibiscus sabdariffa TaxID=183260 RepID=A0ABR2PF10_9ROSI
MQIEISVGNEVYQARAYEIYFIKVPVGHKPSCMGKNADQKNPVVLEKSSSESSASSDQVELTARLVEKSDLVGCRTEENLEDSGFGGFSTRGLGDGSTKSQCKEHMPKWVVVKGGAARLSYSNPKEDCPCLKQPVADLNSMGLQGIDLSNNYDVELAVNRADDEDPNNLSPGGAVMAQEVLVDNHVILIGSKEVEREELSGRISPVLEHREKDHVTLEVSNNNQTRVWNFHFAVYWHGVLLRIMVLSKLRKNGLLLSTDIDTRKWLERVFCKPVGVSRQMLY